MSARGGAGRVLRVYAVTFLIFLYGPVILLPIFAFNDSAIIAFPLTGVTTKWFQQLWEADVLHQSVINSLYVGLSAATISTILGICAARASARYEFPAKKGIVSFIMLPLVLPDILVAVSLLVVLIQIGLSLSLGSVILGHVLICTPFSIAILTSAFHSLDQSLEEASLDLGETRMGTFFRVTLPLVTPGLISSMLISFTISLDEFIIAFFLTGTEPTMPVYIWSQLRFTSKLPSVVALGCMLLLISLLLLFAAEYFRRRANRRSGTDDTTGGFL